MNSTVVTAKLTDKFHPDEAGRLVEGTLDSAGDLRMTKRVRHVVWALKGEFEIMSLYTVTLNVVGVRQLAQVLAVLETEGILAAATVTLEESK